MNVLPGQPQQTPITHLHRMSEQLEDSISHTQVVRKKHGHRVTLLLSIYVQSKSDSDRKTGTERKQLWSDLKFTVLPCYHCLCSSRINMINVFLIIWENQSLLWIKWLINNLLFDVYDRSFPLLLRILQMIKWNDVIFSLIFSALSYNRVSHILYRNMRYKFFKIKFLAELKKSKTTIMKKILGGMKFKKKTMLNLKKK